MLKRLLLTPAFMVALALGAHAQQTIFVPLCTGSASVDTAKFTAIKATIGSTVPGTIRLPRKANSAQRCHLNNFSTTANITIDNSDGDGIFIVTGQTVTLVGPAVSPARPFFYNATAGLGTVSFSGNKSIAEVRNEWWGATIGSGQSQATRIINRLALQEATNGAIAANATLKVPSVLEVEFENTNAATAKIAVTGDLVVEGAGQQESVLSYFPTAPAFAYYGFYVTAGKNLSVRHLTMQGPAAGSGAVTVGIWYDGGPYATGVTGSLKLYDVKIGGQFYESIAKSGTGAGGQDNWTTNFLMDIDLCDITGYFQEITCFTSGGRVVADANITAGATTLTSATAAFTLADEGASVFTQGAGTVGGGGTILASIITHYTNSTTVTIANAALATVTPSAETAIGAPANIRLSIRNSYIHDQVLGSAGGYFIYVHPSVSLDIQHNRFVQGPSVPALNFGIHNYSGGGISSTITPQYQKYANNSFEGNIDNAILTSPNFHPTISANTFTNNGYAVMMQTGAADMVDNQFLGNGVVRVLTLGASVPLNVNITGGRIAPSSNDLTVVQVAWVGSTWNLRDVDFISKGPLNILIANSIDAATLNVTNCHFSGTALRVIDPRKGTTNFNNNIVTGVYSGGAAIDLRGTLVGVNVNNNSFDLSNSFAIEVNDAASNGALRGEGNLFLDDGGRQPVSNNAAAFGALQLKRGLGAVVASGATVTIPTFNFDTYHISGTGTIDNIIVYATAAQRVCGGKIYLIFDSTAATSAAGNIKPKSVAARVANTMAAFQYDTATGFWYEQ